jgi:hypothetical protein
LNVSYLDARAETSNDALFYLNRMTDKRMKVSLRIAFAMSRFSNVKAIYEGFVVKINGRDWTVNIMMFGETTLALLAGNEPEE